MAKISQLISEQRECFDDLVSFMSNFKKDIRAHKSTKHYWIKRAEMFEEIWQDLLKRHRQILNLKASTDVNDLATVNEDDYFVKGVFGTIQETYLDYSNIIEEERLKFFPLAEAPASETLAPHSTALNITTAQNSLETRLPRIDLPKFNGDFRQWAQFRDTYISVVHSKTNVPNVDKLNYLKSSLIGNLKGFLDSYTITDANYELAWQDLMSSFDNQRKMIEAHMVTLLELPQISKESSSDIKKLTFAVKRALQCLKSLAVQTEHWDPLLVVLVGRQLPTETLKLWEQSLKNPKEIPKWNELLTFLEERYRTLEAVEDSLLRMKPSASLNNSKASVSKSNVNSLMTTASASTACNVCHKEKHSLSKCSSFKLMSVESRWDLAKNLNLCFNCLGAHRFQACTSKEHCRFCPKRHHTLLHKNKIDQKTASTGSQSPKGTQDYTSGANNSPMSQPGPSITSLAASSSNLSDTVLLGTILLETRVNNKPATLRAIIDTASQASFVTEEACRKLRLHKRSKRFSICGIGNSTSAHASNETEISIFPRESHYPEIKITCIVIPKIIDPLQSIMAKRTNWGLLKNLPLADPFFDKPGKIDLLLGADIYGEIVTGTILKGKLGVPTAIESHFGWILIGKILTEPSETKVINSLISCVQLEHQLKQFWEIENFPPKKVLSDTEISCEEHFVQNHTRDREENGRYVIKLPFCQEPPLLGESRKIALQRYLRVEKSLQLKNELENYRSILREYLELGHLEKVNIPSQESSNSYCYLPHHAVFKAESTSTRLRIVFDASCKTSNGKSLNDNLHIGPKLQTDLVDIILRWRLYRYVISADIAKMYRQILVHSDHRDFQRILCRLESTSEIEDFRLNRVTFGINCAPFLAIRVIHQLAKDEEKSFPMASKVLTSDMYVDDILTGAHTIDQALEVQSQLTKMFERGGFELRKWGSNEPKILEHIPKEHVNPKLQLCFEKCSVKTLGISWEPNSDLFSFQAKLPILDKHSITKREVLSLIAQIYDPMGWLGPFLIVCKMFMQKLWLERLDWDELLPAHLQNEWNNFTTDFSNLEAVRVPRWTNFTANSSLEIHGFSDASEKAYAAVIYWRLKDGEKYYSSLIISKTKVAPVKTISLPRLELCGAVLLARLLNKVLGALPFEPAVFLWSDSTIVLHWLTLLPSTLKTFVANRVSELQETTQNCQWNHVKSKDNPADLASRGIKVKELIDNPFWWAGPYWLQENSETWPKGQKILGSNLEIKRKEVKSLLVLENSDFLERFSSFSRMIRVFCYVFRFIQKNNSHLRLQPTEIKITRNRLIQMVQNQYFNQEYQNLRSKEQIDSQSILRTFNPFLDSDGIIRSKSRLEHSNLPYSERFPIILPYAAQFTKLYVQEIHKLTLHGNVQLMMSVIRRQFWIPRLTNLVKLVIRQCIICTRYKSEAQQQIMGALPSERVIANRCFSNVGMDYCGPFIHKLFEGRCPKTDKCYVLIIVCFTSRMIHLELVSNLSAEAFIAALERFISRRSMPNHIFCDNATYFKGADRLMQLQLKKAVKQSIDITVDKYATQGMKFHFSPPAGPHFNGMAEAGVKSVKYHLRRTIGCHSFTFEKFCTILAKIEACLNSRPLAPLTNNPEDLTPLTPGHLCIGHNLITPPEEDISENSIPPNKYWRIVQQIRQNFWVRWSQEYLHQLKARHKWQFQQCNQKVGQMVILKNELLPPQEWKLGRITRVHPGPDGLVRVVTIKCTSGEYKRPITKLVILPIQTD